MPRVKPLTETDRRNALVRKELDGYTAEQQMDDKHLADLLGISTSTLYNRKNDPSSFKLGEIRKLEKLFPGIQIK